MPDDGAREIGRVYAARGPWSDDLMPGDPADEAMFESRPIPAEAWQAFEDMEAAGGLCWSGMPVLVWRVAPCRTLQPAAAQ